LLPALLKMCFAGLVMFDKATLLSQRGQFCDCGCGQFSHDAHHALVPNLKRFAEWCNDERNIILVNHAEHVELRKFDNREWRVKLWKRQCVRYGYNSMMEWINQCPAKLRHRLDFIRE